MSDKGSLCVRRRSDQVLPKLRLILERFLDFKEDVTPGLVPIAGELIEKVRLPEMRL